MAEPGDSVGGDVMLVFRLPRELRDRFKASSGDMSGRLRYLIERDLSERARKRAGKPVQRDLGGNASE